MFSLIFSLIRLIRCSCSLPFCFDIASNGTKPFTSVAVADFFQACPIQGLPAKTRPKFCDKDSRLALHLEKGVMQVR